MSTILVAGMHRSGTSVLSRFVGLLVGYQGQRGAAHDNVEGHWEDPRVNRILDRALWAMDADWASPPLEPMSFGDPRLAGTSDELRAVLTERPGDPLVLKDPRLCLALDAVARLLPAPPLVVATFREPREVAASVATRDGYQPEYGLALWEIYTRLLLQQCARRGGMTTWVSYQALLRAPDEVAERLIHRWAESGLSVLPDAVASARESINPALHHEKSFSDLVLSRQQQDLLSLLQRAEAEGLHSPIEIPALTPWARALVETRRPFARMERQNRLLVQRLRRVHGLYRLVDRVRAAAGRPVPPDPFSAPF